MCANSTENAGKKKKKKRYSAYILMKNHNDRQESTLPVFLHRDGYPGLILHQNYGVLHCLDGLYG